MVRFFMVVRPWHNYGLVAFGIVALVGLATIGMDPREIDSALGMVLFAQMFVASSGFVSFARGGHFDPVLIHGHNRAAALAAHWFASTAPGVTTWFLLAGAAQALGSPAALSALIGSRLAAFLIVSATAWTLGFALPRGAGGALWMGLLLVVLLRHVRFLDGAPLGNPSLDAGHVAATLLLCPFLLLGTHRPIGTAPIAAALGAALLILLVTWRAGARLDLFLEERA